MFDLYIKGLWYFSCWYKVSSRSSSPGRTVAENAVTHSIQHLDEAFVGTSTGDGISDVPTYETSFPKNPWGQWWLSNMRKVTLWRTHAIRLKPVECTDVSVKFYCIWKMPNGSSLEAVISKPHQSLNNNQKNMSNSLENGAATVLNLSPSLSNVGSELFQCCHRVVGKDNTKPALLDFMEFIKLYSDTQKLISPSLVMLLYINKIHWAVERQTARKRETTS